MKRIPFRPELARAVREGRKTETRRVIRPQPPADFEVSEGFNGFQWSKQEHLAGGRIWMGTDGRVPKPAYAVGEVIGLVEPWSVRNSLNSVSGSKMIELGWSRDIVHYLADGEAPPMNGRLRLARFMPDAFVRTRLRVTGVSVERVQEITLGQICAEGLATTIYDFKPVQRGFDAWEALWNEIHGAEGLGWDVNPWVFRYQFEVLK